MIDNTRISVSYGNRKMGAIPSVSLPAVVTCPHGCKCAVKCYAARMCKYRKNVGESYNRNLRILAEDPTSYWQQVRTVVACSTYFRYNVSGDIPTYEYLLDMIETAEMFPGNQQLVFTKRYEWINQYIRENGDLPANLHVMLSPWPGMKMENPYNLPVAMFIPRGDEMPADVEPCHGHCMECAINGYGCFAAGKGDKIGLMEH